MTFTNHWQELIHIPPAPKSIKVFDIYPKDTIIPDGYDVIAFRPPIKGDLYLTTGSWCVYACDFTDPGTFPRLILKLQKKRKIVFTEIRRGRVEPGEWYSYDGCVSPVKNQKTWNHSNVIAYRREEIEE